MKKEKTEQLLKRVKVHRVDTYCEGPEFDYPHEYLCPICNKTVSRENFITSYNVIESFLPKFVYSVKNLCRNCRDSKPM